MLWSLFKSFLKVGSFTIGGGYAMIPLIQSEVVDRHGWLTNDEFVDALAVAQSTPGALAVNMSAYVGFKKAGFKGATVSTLGCSLPAIIPILIIAMFFNKFMDVEIIKKAFMGFRPAVAALIVYSVYKIAKAGKIKRNWYIITIIATISLVVFEISPLIIIFLSAVAGAVFGRRSFSGTNNNS